MNEEKTVDKFFYTNDWGYVVIPKENETHDDFCTRVFKMEELRKTLVKMDREDKELTEEVKTAVDGKSSSEATGSPQSVLNGEKVVCPQCGGEMQERDGKYGKFYGCKSYPNCKGIIKVN